MNITAVHCSLFLCPNQYNFTLKDISPLVSALQTIGFISQKINQSETNNAFYTGDRFLEYIAYMGCSPAIQFEASGTGNETNSDFCHIRIHHYKSAKLIYSQKQSRAPHCPNCSKPVKDWRNNKSASAILCNQCHTSSNIAEFNWRKMAGYAQLFIEITDIYPKEAIPQQLLLDKLSGIYDMDWLYFYSCQ